MIELAPSILSADFAHLADHIQGAVDGGATLLHVDVMDGHFVPNLTMGPPVVKSIRKATGLELDLHLMIEDPDKFVTAFVEAGADRMSVHQEACRHLHRTIQLIQSEGVGAGVVLNPATPVATLEDVLGMVDYVLVMSVNPGFGGQEFIPHALDKIRRLNQIRQDARLDFAIEIDGGVSTSNVEEIVRAGCDWLVAGSSIFHSADPGATVKEMQHLATEARAIRV